MSPKILIIDDDVDTLKLVGIMLEKQGYQIIASDSGEKGLSMAEVENPDVILLDVMMPEMDGFEVAKRLRLNPLTAETPILMFTAKAQLDDKVSGFESGADDYLTKPAHPTELSAHVKALLTRSSKNRNAPTQQEEKRAYTIGVLAPHGGQGVTTMAANLGEALRVLTKGDVVVAELRPGMGTLGPELGEADPSALTELISGKMADMTRQKIQEKLFIHKTGLRLLFGTVRAKDGLLKNIPAMIEGLVNRLSFLTPYLVLDLGAGLTPMNQRLLPSCNLILVLVEPVTIMVVHSKTLINDIADLCDSRENIQAVMVNRIRSDTQIDKTQIEEFLGQTPLVSITPTPELMYTASRTHTTAINSRPDSLTAQQFAKLAEDILGFEKRKKK